MNTMILTFGGLPKTPNVVHLTFSAEPPAKTLYVDASAGSDSNSGKSASKALATAAAALALANDHDTILLKYGSTFAVQLSITGFDGLTIDAYGSSGDGLPSFEPASGVGLAIDSCVGLSINNIAVVALSPSTGVVTTNSQCDIADSELTGSPLAVDNGVGTVSPSLVNVRRCAISGGIRDRVSTAGAGQQIHVTENTIIVLTNTNAFNMSNPGSTVRYNSIFKNNAGTNWIVEAPAGNTGLIFTDNILRGTGQLVWLKSGLADHDFDRNVLWDTGNGGQVLQLGPSGSSTTHGRGEVTLLGAASVAADDLMVSPATGDWTLGEESPAFGIGLGGTNAGVDQTPNIIPIEVNFSVFDKGSFQAAINNAINGDTIQWVLPEGRTTIAPFGSTTLTAQVSSDQPIDADGNIVVGTAADRIKIIATGIVFDGEDTGAFRMIWHRPFEWVGGTFKRMIQDVSTEVFDVNEHASYWWIHDVEFGPNCRSRGICMKTNYAAGGGLFGGDGSTIPRHGLAEDIYAHDLGSASGAGTGLGEVTPIQIGQGVSDNDIIGAIDTIVRRLTVEDYKSTSAGIFVKCSDVHVSDSSISNTGTGIASQRGGSNCTWTDVTGDDSRAGIQIRGDGHVFTRVHLTDINVEGFEFMGTISDEYSDYESDPLVDAPQKDPNGAATNCQLIDCTIVMSGVQPGYTLSAINNKPFWNTKLSGGVTGIPMEIIKPPIGNQIINCLENGLPAELNWVNQPGLAEYLDDNTVTP